MFKRSEITIAEWRSSDFETIKQVVKKAETLKRKAGVDSKVFQAACRKLLEAASKGDSAVNNCLQRKVDIRALTFLLACSDPFSEKYSFNSETLSHIFRVRERLGTLNLTQLIRAYFMRYDTLAGEGEIDLLCQFITEQIQVSSNSHSASLLSKQKDNASTIFDIAGTKKVTDLAIANNEDLEVTFERLGLNGYTKGRFQNLCRYRYYIEQLKVLDVNLSHPLLHEVSSEQVYMAPSGDGQLIGHLVLETIIDRDHGDEISEPWQQVILSIASDPRVSTTSEDYQKWWIPLGKERVEKVRGWLSRYDLKLFLEVLKITAEQTGNQSKIEMFKTRKKFMEGLLELKLIKNTRLFLGKRAALNLRRAQAADQLTAYAELDSADTSIIYLNIGGLHMIEGTHSFKVKVMDEVPENLSLLDYRYSSYDNDRFRARVGRDYQYIHGNTNGFIEASHDVHLNWQNKLIDFFADYKIEIPPERVLTKSQNRAYLRKFGRRV